MIYKNPSITGIIDFLFSFLRIMALSLYIHDSNRSEEYGAGNMGNISINALDHGQKTDILQLHFELLDKYKWIIILIYTAVTIFSLTGNLVVILTFFKFKCLRSIHDKLIINLAFLNLFTTIGVPFYISYTIFPGYVLKGKTLCLLNFAFTFGGITVSVFIHFGLAMERYFCIVNPEVHRKLRNRHVLAWSIVSFFCGMQYSLLPIMGWNDWDKYHVCVVDVFPYEFSLIEQCIVIAILLANGILHIYILRVAISHSKRIDKLVLSVRYVHVRNHPLYRHGRKENKAVTTVMILAGLSTVSWIPHIVLTAFHKSLNMDLILQFVVVQLAYIPVIGNTCASPFIFGCRNRHFRNSIKCLITRQKHQCCSF